MLPLSSGPQSGFTSKTYSMSVSFSTSVALKLNRIICHPASTNFGVAGFGKVLWLTIKCDLNKVSQKIVMVMFMLFDYLEP